MKKMTLIQTNYTKIICKPKQVECAVNNNVINIIYNN